MKEVVIHGIRIQLLKKDWMLTTYERGSLINATILEDLREAYSDLNGSEDLSSLRLIQVFKGDFDFSRDVSERYLSHRIRPKIGEAFVAEDRKTLEFLNGASAVMSRTHPVEVFPSVDEATAWLESLS